MLRLVKQNRLVNDAPNFPNTPNNRIGTSLFIVTALSLLGERSRKR